MTARRVTAALLILGLSACPAGSSPSLEGAWPILQVELLAPDGTVTLLPHQESLVLCTGDHYSRAYAFGAAPAAPPASPA